MQRLRSRFVVAHPEDPVESRRYEPAGVWKAHRVDEIRLLGMPKGFGYLAYGLEIFLISKLEPEHNKQGRNSSKRSTKSRETKPN